MQTRKRLQSDASAPTAARLFHLTILQAPLLDDRHKRALLESATESLPDSGYRHRLRCRLARLALRAGDGEAAHAWLEPCNPRPIELRQDTDYRLAVAELATRSGAFDKVLVILGERADALPIANEHEVEVSLLRINALERSGRLAEATEQLRGLLLGDTRNVAAARDLIAEYQDLSLCATSYPTVHQQVWVLIDRKLRPQQWWANVWVLAGLLVWTFGSLAAVIAERSIARPSLGMLIEMAVEGLRWLLIVFGIVPGLAVLPIVFLQWRRRQALGKRGELGFARVLASTAGAARRGRLFGLEVEVERPDARQRVTVPNQNHVVPGVYPCLFDPTTPELVVLALNGPSGAGVVASYASNW